jgi:hypothetical protein
MGPLRAISRYFQNVRNQRCNLILRREGDLHHTAPSTHFDPVRRGGALQQGARGRGDGSLQYTKEEDLKPNFAADGGEQGGLYSTPARSYPGGASWCCALSLA